MENLPILVQIFIWGFILGFAGLFIYAFGCAIYAKRTYIDDEEDDDAEGPWGAAGSF